MTYEEEKKLAKKFYEDAISILMMKANDYASDADCLSNFKKIALVCDVPVDKVFLQFLTVKIARLVELTTKENKNESQIDSLIDIANYANLYHLYLIEQKEKNEKL